MALIASISNQTTRTLLKHCPTSCAAAYFAIMTYVVVVMLREGRPICQQRLFVSFFRSVPNCGFLCGSLLCTGGLPFRSVSIILLLAIKSDMQTHKRQNRWILHSDCARGKYQVDATQYQLLIHLFRKTCSVVVLVASWMSITECASGHRCIETSFSHHHPSISSNVG